MYIPTVIKLKETLKVLFFSHFTDEENTVKQRKKGLPKGHPINRAKTVQSKGFFLLHALILFPN